MDSSRSLKSDDPTTLNKRCTNALHAFLLGSAQESDGLKLRSDAARPCSSLDLDEGDDEGGQHTRLMLANLKTTVRGVSEELVYRFASADVTVYLPKDEVRPRLSATKFKSNRAVCGACYRSLPRLLQLFGG